MFLLGCRNGEKSCSKPNIIIWPKLWHCCMILIVRYSRQCQDRQAKITILFLVCCDIIKLGLRFHAQKLGLHASEMSCDLLYEVRVSFYLSKLLHVFWMLWINKIYLVVGKKKVKRIFFFCLMNCFAFIMFLQCLHFLKPGYILFKSPQWTI